jgi:hypothetical protein
MNNDWEKDFESEFGIHFKSDELQFAKEFIRTLIDKEKGTHQAGSIEHPEKPTTEWIQCNPCFDGDHNECVDKRCECPKKHPECHAPPPARATPEPQPTRSDTAPRVVTET